MHKVSFSQQFEKEITAMGHSVKKLKTDLKLHLDSVSEAEMPIDYLGRTGAFDYPQSVVDSGLKRIHVYDFSCQRFNSEKQAAWNRSSSLHKRTSDTYFLYINNFFDEHHCHFLGVINPAHIKCSFKQSGMKWFGPFIDAANKFNGI